MQLSTSLLGVAAAFFTVVSAGDPGVVRYDSTYDNPNLSTLSTACSDGKNGLFTKGYRTLGDLPGFPLVGASATIAGWNSTECGRCYKVYYRPTQKSIYITAVDVASPFGSGAFVLSKQAMDLLTGGKAAELGRADVSWIVDSPQSCGFANPPTSTVTTVTPTVTTRTPTGTLTSP